jgi:hypothetical protein
MNAKQTETIRELVKQERYDDARRLLVMIRDHDPDARTWLSTLDDITAQRNDMRKTKIEKREAGKWLTQERLMTNLAVSSLFVPLLRLDAVIAIALYWAYDWYFNDTGKLPVSRVVAGVVVCGFIAFGVRALLGAFTP